MSFKKDLINAIELFADLMDFKGENRFKINAFKNGANIVRRLEGNIEELIHLGKIQEVKGIGKGLSSFMAEFYQKGTVEDLENIQKEIPNGLMEIFNIRGLGARKIKVLYDELGIENISYLENACSTNKIADLKGFGEKSQEKILEEINRFKKASGYLRLNRAENIADKLVEELTKIKVCEKTIISGQIRRALEIINKIEIVILVSDIKKFLSELSKTFKYSKLSDAKYDIVHLKGFEIETLLYIGETEKNLSEILFLTTGSDKFLEKLEFDPKEINCKSEEEIFKNLGINFIIPEMREEQYFELNSKMKDNSDLDLSKFKGFLHFHTTQSDGVNTLSEMAAKAESMGFEYLAVCDHSKSAFYANGLKENRILLQKKEIEQFNSSSKIKAFHGIESDILIDGNLDYDSDFMNNFDFVVASIHSRFDISEEDMTKRIIIAVENKFTDLLAHPTGRLLLSRDGYKVNIKKVIDACSANNVAIEINANPHRLDLDWRNIYYAREKGCMFSINPDAHSTEGIEEIEYGIKIGRKGGIQSSEVINCFDLNEFKLLLNRKVKRINL